jgi:hypothetical protein
MSERAIRTLSGILRLIPDRLPAGDVQAFLLANGYCLFRLEKGGRVGEKLLAPMRHGSAMLLAVPLHMRI